ncbi:MAG: protein kinase [Verrucomicrobia bacterium]|nr:protein kinase [Verrucomicrobiota bacterium]
MPSIEETVGYELVRPIARGGMGCVYEAVQKGPDGFRKRVALKIIRQEYSRVPAFRKNFLGEARLVADLIHTNIVQIYHLGSHGKQYFIVMELVDGVNLEEFLLQHRALKRPVPAEWAVFIISRVTRALAYAHEQRDAEGRFLHLVHRDVSPRNIMLSRAGDVKLTDFGIAKAFNLMYSEEGEVVAGRSDYLSPEQARMEVTDARADLFSCGVVLLELLLGYNPFAAPSPEQSRENIRRLPMPDLGKARPGLDPRISAAVLKCLARRREDRFQSAESLLSALEHALYDKAYGPTNEKLALYLRDLYKEGIAYEDDFRERVDTFPSS